MSRLFTTINQDNQPEILIKNLKAKIAYLEKIIQREKNNQYLALVGNQPDFDVKNIKEKIRELRRRQSGCRVLIESLTRVD